MQLDRRRLVLVIRLLDSPHDGEKLAAIAAAKRLLDVAGMSWADLVEPEPEPIRRSPPPRHGADFDPGDMEQTLYEILDRDTALLERGIACLTQWERDFTESMLERWSAPSPKQSAILDRIKAKIKAAGG